MNFLARFKSGPEVEQDLDEAPPRRRTFSATQYREQELARALEAHAAAQAAEAAAIAAAKAAEEEARKNRWKQVTGMDPNGLQAAADAAAAAAGPATPPMDWEEAVGWLSTRSSEARSLVAQTWNWDHDLRVLQFLTAQPDMDMGVAAGIFWLTGATDDFFPWGDDEDPQDPQFKRATDMVTALGRRFAAEDFSSQRFGFDDSWDCSGLKERLEALYLDGRIDWTPANLPTVSPGPLVTIEDVPENERSEVADFLRRHGA